MTFMILTVLIIITLYILSKTQLQKNNTLKDKLKSLSEKGNTEQHKNDIELAKGLPSHFDSLVEYAAIQGYFECSFGYDSFPDISGEMVKRAAKEYARKNNLHFSQRWSNAAWDTRMTFSWKKRLGIW